MITKTISNLIFDFGGVIYRIDHVRQIEAFKKIGISAFECMYSQALQIKLFTDLETGLITEDCFRHELLKLADKNCDIREVDAAWNSILAGFEPAIIDLLLQLKTKYRLFLVSNTNTIHYRIYTSEFLERFHFSLEEIFDKVYWSFKTGFRKPDKKFFEIIISENGFTSDNSIFIDDSLQNVIAAERAGLRSHWLKKPMLSPSLFDKDLTWINQKRQPSTGSGCLIIIPHRRGK